MTDDVVQSTSDTGRWTTEKAWSKQSFPIALDDANRVAPEGYRYRVNGDYDEFVDLERYIPAETERGESGQ